jgi:hypothetical protein
MPLLQRVQRRRALREACDPANSLIARIIFRRDRWTRQPESRQCRESLTCVAGIRPLRLPAFLVPAQATCRYCSSIGRRHPDRDGNARSRLAPNREFGARGLDTQQWTWKDGTIQREHYSACFASGIDRQFGILLTNRRFHTNKAELPCAARRTASPSREH